MTNLAPATRAYTNRAAPLPVFLGVDVEPDALLLDPAAPSGFEGYEAAHRYLSELRPRLEAQTGAPARYCWYVRMDPQIARVYGSAGWIASRYERLLERSAHAGDEIGLHLHFHRWRADRGDWLLDLADRAWVEDAFAIGLEAFGAGFGRSCRTVHLGGWVNDELLHLAERAGIRFDLSLRPGQRPVALAEAGGVVRGTLPSHAGVPRHAYHPARRDFRRGHPTDHLSLLTIPHTVGPWSLGRSVAGAARVVKRVLTRGPGHWRALIPLHPRLSLPSPNSFGELLARALAAKPGHLAFVERTDFGTRHLPQVRQAMDTIVEQAAHRRLVFTTPPAAFAPPG